MNNFSERFDGGIYRRHPPDSDRCAFISQGHREGDQLVSCGEVMR